MVLTPWGQTRQAIAEQMGIAENEFMARMPEIVSERSRIASEAEARYNTECYSAVIKVYSYARCIGFTDADMERCWRAPPLWYAAAPQGRRQKDELAAGIQFRSGLDARSGPRPRWTGGQPLSTSQPRGRS
jgi:hypothetical protein